MRVPKAGSRRIEFKTKTIEQKILYLTKCEEMGFDSISEMARQAFEQLIEGSNMTSPEVFRLQRGLQEKDERIMDWRQRSPKTQLIVHSTNSHSS